MSAPTIRPFAPSDLSPVAALWNRCLEKDPITEERFWQLFLLDPNFDRGGLLVAEADGQVVGLLQAMARRFPLGSPGLQPQQGWITVFLVDSAWRRQGIGTALLEAGLSFLKSKGRTQVSCNGYAPYYIFPGVDVDYEAALAFLQAHGFTVASEPVAMGMALEGVRMPDTVRERQAALAAEGYAVRLFERRDTLPLLAFVEAQFPYWQPSVLEGLQRGNFEIVVAEKAGEIVGFTQWQNPHNDPPSGAAGRFGPFGVHPELRGHGLGAALFYTLVERAAGSGGRYLWFGWAGGRNLSFYERAGCRVTRRFRILVRAL